MRSLISRAELLRIAALLGRDALSDAASGLGFERAERSPGVASQPERERALIEPSRADSIVVEPEELAPVPFWQPYSLEVHDKASQEALVHRVEKREAEAELLRPWERGGDPPPTTPPLSPWRRTGPQLQQAVTEECEGRRLDIRGLVRCWSRGKMVRRLPRLRRRAWVPLVVLVDRALRLVPFWDDQAFVIDELAQLLGVEGIELCILADGPVFDGDELSGCWRDLVLAGRPVLALTDLGWYAGSAEREAWRRLGLELRGAGLRLHALVPVPRVRWTDELARLWQAEPWERPVAPVDTPEGNADIEARAARLMRSLGPAMRVEPGLIRAVRLLIPRGQADVGTEADVWASPELGELFSEARAFVPERADQLRRAFLDELPEEEQRRVIAVLRAWHLNEERRPEAWHLEVLALAEAHEQMRSAEDSALIGTDERRRAEAFVSWLAGDLRAVDDGRVGPGLSRGRRSALRTWCRFLQRQEPAIWSRETAVGESLQMIAHAVGGVDIPDLDPRLRALLEDRGEERTFKHSVEEVWQAGCTLVFIDREMIERGRAPAGVRIGSFWGQEPEVVLDEGEKRRVVPGFAGPLAMFKVGRVASLDVRTFYSCLKVRRLTKPSWARAIGRDGYGLWAELFVKGVGYRMRWIPPGRFVMGSPEGEPGRYKDEGPQHEVTITRGFWLGETPVTQALWEAVMGENPSHFKTPDRPVEQVSWEDCQGEGGLMERLHRALDPEEGVGGGDLGRFRLPTEAEWEYACRAGTRTATYAGAIEILGENNAPVLDEIAWYGGNSGVEYDLDEGVGSSEWSEKQHEHSKAGTRRVAQKLANAWGLHDMLGNVWEWCMDYADLASGYASEPQQDPSGPATGESRVSRGGAWYDDARRVRAAFRNALHPGFRRLGLRLARDQGGPVGPEGPGGPDPEGGESPEGQERG